MNCRAESGTGTFLLIKGEESEDIRIIGNDFSKAHRGWLDTRQLSSEKPIDETANLLRK